MMNTDAMATYSEWRSNLLATIQGQPDTVAMGNAFVRGVLQTYFELSEEDATNATAYAGAGDRGVDALHIVPSEEDDEAGEALVVQGKYGNAGVALHVYDEAMKFLSSLKEAQGGKPITEAVNKAAAVMHNGGTVRYVVATVEPLSDVQQHHLENVKTLAHRDFGDKLVIQGVNLENVYAYLSDNAGTPPRQVHLPCKVVPVDGGAFIGATSLADMFGMLRAYATLADGSADVNTIYDRNIRKYLKRRPGSVNEGIHSTLKNHPTRFIAYNNGITIVCDAAEQIESGLQLTNPYIVNGCQTTRTLYDYMDTKFAGIPEYDPQNSMADYKSAYMAIKVLAVAGNDRDEYANNITRFSNKQNAVRGKDFIALEDLYRTLKAELKKSGYFLETQNGEYDALPHVRKQQYPKSSHVINSFEATLVYAAGVLGKPHTAFGRSIAFAPGGQEFESLIADLQADDLLVAWLIANDARELGYTSGVQRDPKPDNRHRVQTRYLFLYFFFCLAREMLQLVNIPAEPREQLYAALHTLIAAQHGLTQQERAMQPLGQLLTFADEAVYTYMRLAEQKKWFDDRNSYLKRDVLIDETRVILALSSVGLRMQSIAEQAKNVITN